MSPELEAAVSKLERKARRSTISDCRRVTLALKKIGATSAANFIEGLIAKDEQTRSEALETAAFVRRVAG